MMASLNTWFYHWEISSHHLTLFTEEMWMKYSNNPICHQNLLIFFLFNSHVDLVMPFHFAWSDIGVFTFCAFLGFLLASFHMRWQIYLWKGFKIAIIWFANIDCSSCVHFHVLLYIHNFCITSLLATINKYTLFYINLWWFCKVNFCMPSKILIPRRSKIAIHNMAS